MLHSLGRLGSQQAPGSAQDEAKSRPKTRHGNPFRGQQLFAARSMPNKFNRFAQGTMMDTKRKFLNALGFKMCPQISSKMVSGMPFEASWEPFQHSSGRLGRQQAPGSAQDEPGAARRAHGVQFANILEPFWDHVGTILGPLWVYKNRPTTISI